MGKSILWVLAAIITVCMIAIPAAALDTEAPTIVSITVSPNIAAAGDLLHVVVNATDDISVTSVTADQITLSATTGNNWEGDVPAGLTYGEYAVSVVARDAAGKLATADGPYRILPVVGISNRSVLDSIMNPAISSVCSDYLFRVWGKATYLDQNTFSVSDGSPLPITVIAPDHSVIDNDYVWARGILDVSSAQTATLNSAQYSFLAMAPRTPMTINDVTVGKNLQTYINNGTLPNPVAYGATLKVTIQSTDSAKVLLSKTATGLGSSTITLTVQSGSSTIPAFYIQGLADSGVVDVVATAPGGYGKTFKVNLAPSGFYINPININTNSMAANSNVQVRPARLNPSTNAYVEYQPLRAGISDVSVNVASSDTGVGTITNNPLIFKAGMDSINAQFDPVGPGMSTISIDTPDGFKTPSNYQSITATVTAPDITSFNATVGKDLQKDDSFSLNTAPLTPRDVTITVADSSIATLSKARTTAGSDSITFNGVSSTAGRAFYIVGIKKGTTTFTVSAEGYNPVTKNITVNPSGFVITTASFSTTSLAGNAYVAIKPALLSPTNMSLVEYQPLRTGVTQVDVSVTSSNTAVGTIVDTPLHFSGNMDTQNAEFHPVGSGETTILIGTPTSFDTPSSFQSITATVTASDIIANNVIVGKDLQKSSYFYLSAAPAPVDVTVTSGNPLVAVITKDRATAGSTSVTFSGVDSNANQTFYVQGIATGTTSLKISAPGYNDANRTITVDPSGFVIATGNISTSTLAGNIDVQIKPARLNSSRGYVEYLPLRAGISDVSITVTSSNIGAGTIVQSPVLIGGNADYKNAQFDPVGAGTSTISIGTPAGFQTPTSLQNITATVTVPNIVANTVTVGKDLQMSSYCYLGSAPSEPVNVTVTVGDPLTAIVSTSSNTAGSGSVTFPGVNGTQSLSFYVQGLKVGSTNITVTADNYISTVKTITVDPSGFVITSPTSINCAATAGNYTLTIKPARLNPTTKVYAAAGALRAGISPVSVSVTSSNPVTGTITASPISFAFGVNNNTTQFDPIAAGTTSISVEPPDGFATPVNSSNAVRTINAVVN